MPDHNRIRFAPFDLDPVNECLWRGAEVIKLRPKAFAVLEHLLSRPGELVTKQSLIGAVWPDTFVGDAVLKVAIKQIREALSDDPKSPRFIETAHRRGYRFIAAIESAAPRRVLTREAPSGVPAERARRDPPGAVVGRELALSRMHHWFEKSRNGDGQVIFVTGEAGIGKTTLLETFAQAISADPAVRICSGQCLEQYGMSEAYLPVLDAMRQLCRDQPAVIETLRTCAPMWLMQMPSLVTPADREAYGREAQSVVRERMLREMGEVLDALTEHAPLVLVLEDLHWSDYATLDLISYVARRRRAAHLMIVGTYRPAELIASGHPLKVVKQELAARQLCDELALEYLTEAAVAQHLAFRFPAHRFPRELPALIHERTEGNPLFMVNTIDHLIAERLIEPHADGWQLTAPIDRVRVGVPDSIRQLIETQVDRLDPIDQRILEAASVAGAEFSALAVAAALDERLADVERRCDEMSRRHQFIRDCGVQALPDGQAVGRCGFVHAVYRHVLYERVSASRRIQLHQRIGRRGEELYGARANEIAAELAMHFERAGELQQAARYLQQAAVNATHRSAYREGIALARRGLQLLATVPECEARARQELWLCLTLGVPLIATEGYASPEVGNVYRQARQLCARLESPREIPQALWGLWTFHAVKAELSAAVALALEFLTLSERIADPAVAMRGHWAMEITCAHQGNFTLALEHFDQAIALYAPDSDRDPAFADALNPGVALRCFAGWSRWFIGQPDRALAQIEEAVALARTRSEPHGLAHALVFAATLRQLRGERSLALKNAAAAGVVSSEHGLVFYHAMARIVRGWARLGETKAEDAADEMQQGLDAWHRTGAQLMRPHFLALLAEAWPVAASGDRGLALLDEALALAESTGERCYQAELYRLKAERLLLCGQREAAEAQACLEQSLAVARHQEALSLELRTAVSLARLHQQHGDRGQIRDLIAPIYARFSEGFDTIDLRNARRLLDAAR